MTIDRVVEQYIYYFKTVEVQQGYPVSITKKKMLLWFFYAVINNNGRLGPSRKTFEKHDVEKQHWHLQSAAMKVHKVYYAYSLNFTWEDLVTNQS